MTLTVGSLFAGIGGFDLAAEWMGWRTIWVSEIDPYCCEVLNERFPAAPNLGDCTNVSWHRQVAQLRPDVLCGGFPCQPHSVAGERRASADDRDLWSQCVRCLRDLRPRYAVFENVPGLLTSESGGFFNRVLSDLAALGYDAEWSVFSAESVGAPHQRDRVWLVAYPERAGRERPLANDGPPRGESTAHPKRLYGNAAPWLALDEDRGWLRGTDGLSLQVERNRLHALGNAIVPQCAVEGPFRRIQELEA